MDKLAMKREHMYISSQIRRLKFTLNDLVKIVDEMESRKNKIERELEKNEISSN